MQLILGAENETSSEDILQRAVAILAVYVLGFIVPWLGGGYVASRSGRTRDKFIPTGYPFLDTAEWQPLMEKTGRTVAVVNERMNGRCFGLRTSSSQSDVATEMRLRPHHVGITPGS